MNRLLVRLGLVLAWLPAACATSFSLDEPYEAPLATPTPGPYRIGKGDKLNIEYTRRFVPVEEYRLMPGDQVDVQIRNRPDVSRQVTVAPDGTITVPMLGRLTVSGLTITELQDIVVEGFSPTVPDPEVSVFLMRGNVLTESFVEMLLLSPTGSVRELSVSEGGRISLPGVGSVQVSGLTLDEAEQQINSRLQNANPDLRVLVNSVKNTRNNFTVVGEVMKPGVFPMDGDVTLVEALATAGWATEYADLEQVVVMSRPDAENIVHASIYDLEEGLTHGNPLSMVRVQQQDTVLVPRTGVGNMNRFIEQYFLKNYPVRFGVNYRLEP